MSIHYWRISCIKDIDQMGSRCLMNGTSVYLNKEDPLKFGKVFFFSTVPLTMTHYLCLHHRQDICRARDKCDTLGK